VTVWRPGDLSFVLINDATDHPVVTAQIMTPSGVLYAMAEPELTPDGRVLTLRGVHMHGGEGAGANAIGHANLKVLARTVMERMDFDELVVEGAVRTTGANPGHRPGPLRFRRRVRPPPR
jgi:hypothetical protein